MLFYARTSVSPSAYGYDPMVAQDLANRAAQGRPAKKIKTPMPMTGAYARLQQQAEQAAVDLDIDTLNQTRNAMKSMRAAAGKQTVGDRVSDVLSSAFSSSAGGLVNLAGFAVNAVQDPDSKRRSIRQAQKALASGRTSDGVPLNDAKRQTIQQGIAKMEAEIARWERPDSLTNRIYGQADSLQDTSQQFHEQAKQGLGPAGSLLVDAGVSTLQSTLDNAVGAVTGTGLAPFVIRAFGGATQEARRGGADLDQQLAYGSAQAAKEYVTEKLFGLTGPQRLTGGGSLDGMVSNGIRNVTERLAKTPTGQKALGGVLTWLASGVTEGLEETIGSVIENTLINPNLRQWDPDTRSAQQKFEDGLYETLVGGVSGLMGGTLNLGTYQTNSQAAAQTGIDAYTQNQLQKQLDRTRRAAERRDAEIQSIQRQAEQEAADWIASLDPPRPIDLEAVRTQVDPGISAFVGDMSGRQQEALQNVDALKAILDQINAGESFETFGEGTARGSFGTGSFAGLDYGSLTAFVQQVYTSELEKTSTSYLFNSLPENTSNNSWLAEDLYNEYVRQVYPGDMGQPSIEYQSNLNLEDTADSSQLVKALSDEYVRQINARKSLEPFGEKSTAFDNVGISPFAGMDNSDLADYIQQVYASEMEKLSAMYPSDLNPEIVFDNSQLAEALYDEYTWQVQNNSVNQILAEDKAVLLENLRLMRAYMDGESHNNGELLPPASPSYGGAGTYEWMATSLLTPDGQDGIIQETLGLEKIAYEKKKQELKESYPESREAFLKRGFQALEGGFESGPAAFRFRRPQIKNISKKAFSARQELIKLGVPAIIVDGYVEKNVDGFTITHNHFEGGVMGKGLAAVSNNTGFPPLEIAGHEAFHFWAGTEARKVFEDIIGDQLLYTSEVFKDYEKTISTGYYGDEVSLSDKNLWDGLMEELYAYIAGHIHSGEWDSKFRLMFRDYNTVKAAWYQLAEYGRTHPAEMPFPIWFGTDE